MQNPPLSPARELTSYSWTAWDALPMVRAAIRQLEMGVMDSASQVVDAMWLDDRIGGCFETRLGGLLTLPLSFEPKGDGRRKDAVSKELEKDFWTICPDHALIDIARWGFFLNAGLGELIWEKSDSKWMPRLKVWHPRFLRWDDDRDCYVLTTRDGQLDITPGDRQWVLFQPYGRKGWMRSLARRLFIPWLIRMWGWRDAARYSEVYGSPTRLAEVPAGTQKDEANKFFRAVSQLSGESTIYIPAYEGTNGEKFDVRLLEAKSTGGEFFLNLVREANTCIAISILGQNLTTEVKGGSFAATKVHERVGAIVLTSDAELVSTFAHEQVITPYCEINYGDGAVAPYPIWDTTPEEDAKAKGEALGALGDGITKLQQTGAKPDIDRILTDAGVPTTEKAGEPPAPALPANVTPLRAAASRQLDKGDRALVEGQSWIDALVEASKAMGAAAMRPDLAALNKVIQGATSFVDLRQKLAPLLELLDEEGRAEVLEKAMVLAELAGRSAVLEGL